MRFAWFALVASILIWAPLIGGCEDSKKKPASGGEMVTPPKKHGRGVEHPRFPDPPPKR